MHWEENPPPKKPFWWHGRHKANTATYVVNARSAEAKFLNDYFAQHKEGPDGWAIGDHGTHPYALYSMLYHGPKKSDSPSRGEEFVEGAEGVYTGKPWASTINVLDTPILQTSRLACGATSLCAMVPTKSRRQYARNRRSTLGKVS